MGLSRGAGDRVSAVAWGGLCAGGFSHWQCVGIVVERGAGKEGGENGEAEGGGRGEKRGKGKRKVGEGGTGETERKGFWFPKLQDNEKQELCAVE